MSVNQVRRWLPITVPAALFIFVFLALGFATNIGLNTAVADAPEPQATPFTGIPVTVQLNLPAEAWGQPAPDVLGVLGETTTYTETFEAGLPVPPPTGPRWVTFDTDYTTVPQNYTWGGTTYTNGVTITGTQSLWSLGDGDIGQTLDPISDTYPANVDSWLVYGPFDLSNQQSVGLAFDFWFDGVSGTAEFMVAHSTDGTTFNGEVQPLPGTTGWFNYSYDGIEDALGEAEVWIAFNFSTSEAAAGKGVFLDNFVLTTEAPDPTPTPTATPPRTDLFMPSIYYSIPPTPTPTPTPSPTPVTETYYIDFGNPNEGDDWTTIRRRNTNGNIDNEVLYTDSALQAQARSRGDYFILSPLKEAIDAPYEIQLESEIMNESEKSGFFVVFGGDYNGDLSSCPNGDFDGCFNEYYLLQVRYRNGDKTETKVSYVGSHDSDNKPIEQTLWGWVLHEKEDLDADDLNKWEIKVESNGAIRIEANDRELVFLDGPRAIENRYFGVGVFSDAEDSTDSRVKFYDYCVGSSDFCRNPNNGGGGGEVLFEQDFSTEAQVDEWEDVRHTRWVTTDNRFRFISPEEDARGLMEMSINKSEQYFIASPMIEGPNLDSTGYTIETNWGFAGESSYDDKLMMGMLFAGNATDASNCLNPELNNCFDQFYMVQVRYRQGNGTPHYEARVKVANGSDDVYPIIQDMSNGPSWQTVPDVFNANEPHTWYISYNSNGTIVVTIENYEVWNGRDTRYEDNRYFGFLLDTVTDVSTDKQAIQVNHYKISEN